MTVFRENVLADVERSVEFGVITGVGQSGPLRDLPSVTVETPYGPPSIPIRIGEVEGRRIAVIARRGDGEILQPHLVPYRANIWALASLGVRTLISSTSCSGMRDAYSPGSYVIPDQILDFTNGRDNTFYDRGDSVQLESAEPFDPTLRALLAEIMTELHVRVRDFGTVAVADGPRFPTAAEARWYATSGADLVNKTLMPETTLAHEAGMSVVNLSFVTDWAPGHGADRSETSSTELIRRRSQQASTTLVHALRLFLARIPNGYTPVTDVPKGQVQALLSRLQPGTF